MKLGLLIKFEEFLAKKSLELTECFRILDEKSINAIMKAKNPYILCELYKKFYKKSNDSAEFMNYFI